MEIISIKKIIINEIGQKSVLDYCRFCPSKRSILKNVKFNIHLIIIIVHENVANFPLQQMSHVAVEELFPLLTDLAFAISNFVSAFV